MVARRTFLADGASYIGALLLSGQSPALPDVQTDSRIEVLLDESLGQIDRNLYGHFIENLSGVVYDGVWVGENSPVPNIGGIRKALVDAMRAISPPVIRFPGGCFADSYDWRDGIGPVSERPRRTNFWADGEAHSAPVSHIYDPNRFGTNEFLRFCNLVGSQPYLAANVRSLPAEDFYQWVEYCNSPTHSTTLADARAAAGHPRPFGVRFWGVGNEAWGCGGNFTPEEYAEEFCRYTAFLPQYGRPLSCIASGPNKDDWSWTDGFFTAIARRGKAEFQSIYGFSLHDYTWNLSRGRTSDWTQGKGDALSFGATDWYELLRQGAGIDSLIVGHWKIMGETDREHSVKLVVDEWGPWYRPGSGPTVDDRFEQKPTLRDAVFSAMTLDIFNRHPDKVVMANCAQLINCLNSLYLAHEDKFCVTPVGHVFAMYAVHQGGMGVRSVFSVPSVHYQRDGKPASLFGLMGSSSLHGKFLVLTVVNPHVAEWRQARLIVRGATIVSGRVMTLTHKDIHACNSFDQPDVIAPKVAEVTFDEEYPMISFQPASVNAFILRLR